MIPELEGAEWRKSSRSNGSGGQCVEVGKTPTVVGVRDSKNPGPTLRFSAAAFQRFLDNLPEPPGT